MESPVDTDVADEFEPEVIVKQEEVCGREESNGTFSFDTLHNEAKKQEEPLKAHLHSGKNPFS